MEYRYNSIEEDRNSATYRGGQKYNGMQTQLCRRIETLWNIAITLEEDRNTMEYRYNSVEGDINTME